MKRFLAFAVCAALLLTLCSPLGAVEKRDKNAPRKPAVAKPQAPQRPAGPQAQPPAKKYDDFIDRNNNGIDDRLENLKVVPAENVAPKPPVKEKSAAGGADKKTAKGGTTKK